MARPTLGLCPAMARPMLGVGSAYTQPTPGLPTAWAEPRLGMPSALVSFRFEIGGARGEIITAGIAHTVAVPPKPRRPG